MQVVDYKRLKACIGMRIPPADFFSHDCTQLLTEEVQAQICNDLQSIIDSNPYYAQTFLRQYLKLLEKSAPIDDIYELFCSSQVLGARELEPTQADTLEYPIDNAGNTVRIREKPKIISGAGTTGLRTWEAALFLSQYLLNGQSGLDLSGKRILELGAGTGLVSLAVAKRKERVGYMQVTITDGDTELLGRLPATFADNDMHDMAGRGVRVKQLVWGEEMVGASDIAPDIVVAADVTYDERILAQLGNTLHDFLQRGTHTCLVAATVRNQYTITAWEQELSRFKWSIVASLSDPHQSEGTFWFRKGTPEIRIYSIQKMS